MILDFCLEHRGAIAPEMEREALLATQELLAAAPAPLGLTGAELHAVAWSSLATRVRAQEGRRTLSELDGAALPALTAIRAPSAAEYARLISKGRLLFEHCLTEVSHHCMMGFMDHELTKSRSAERVVLDLLGWMVEQRLELSALSVSDDAERSERVAQAEYMIDLAVGFLHGLGREQAQRVAAAREP